MISPNLDNLAKIGKLKREKPSVQELRGLLESAESRLSDAANDSLSFASRLRQGLKNPVPCGKSFALQ